MTGLSTKEAESRLEKDGKNKLQEAKKDSLFKRFLKQMADPMIIVLLCAAALSAVTSAYAGESFADVWIILGVVILNSVLGVVQESKAEAAIEALKEMTAAMTKVWRDGRLVTIKSEDLVVGDLIALEAGDSVPADARIVECASLKVEEAALTGESVPVLKQVEPPVSEDGKEIPLGDRKNMLFMGSSVVYGRGTAEITACGMNTEMGHIAQALAQAEDNTTPLQKKLNQLSKILTCLVLGISAAVFLLGVFEAGTLSVPVVLDAFMVAVSLAVAAIPEGLAAVVTIVLSMGVTRMSKQRAVIRKLTAVETLGCTQVICSDKTGTLTQNKMTVVEQHSADEKLLARAMALCSDAEIDEKGEITGEPTEAALVAYANRIGLSKLELKKEYPRVAEAPFDSMRKMMSTLHTEGKHVVQYTKGAPDELLRCCTRLYTEGGVRPMTDADRTRILSENSAMADKALRVLAGAYRIWDQLPLDVTPDNLERDLIFIGLQGMIDPIRPEVKAAVEECGRAGIRVVMITGDHKDTAVAIARELGILGDPEHERLAITGVELNRISDEELDRTIDQYAVFARVQPEHKVRIVRAFKSRGMVTAMTGDGVNDAPSIKSADIGVGMGITGTDVTKNVADMILADDNFATIVRAVEEGRKIYANIRKSIQFLLSSNLSEVMSIFAATLMGFVILKPAHLLWINLITDSFPALALGLEKGEKGAMDRPPRDSGEGIFAGGVAFDILYQGALVSLLTLMAYLIGHFMEAGVWEITDSPDGMTMAFLTMSMAEIFQSFNMRSQRGSLFTIPYQNRYLWGSAALALILTTAVIYIPVFSAAFEFTAISVGEYLVALGLAIMIIPLVEIGKMIARALTKK